MQRYLCVGSGFELQLILKFPSTFPISNTGLILTLVMAYGSTTNIHQFTIAHFTEQHVAKAQYFNYHSIPNNVVPIIYLGLN
jgi:hypothetical protein